MAESGGGTGPDVRELSVRIEALDRHLTAELAGLRRETQSANESARAAVKVAAEEASERLAAHNGLIEQMNKQAQYFASQRSLDDYKETADRRIGRIESFQNKLLGAIALATVFAPLLTAIVVYLITRGAVPIPIPEVPIPMPEGDVP